MEIILGSLAFWLLSTIKKGVPFSFKLIELPFYPVKKWKLTNRILCRLYDIDATPRILPEIRNMPTLMLNNDIFPNIAV